jgi:hypothetical protein
MPKAARECNRPLGPNRAIDRRRLPAPRIQSIHPQHQGDRSARDRRRSVPRHCRIGFSAPLRGKAMGKYPPAKPGALGLEPLEAAGGVADAAPEL